MKRLAATAMRRSLVADWGLRQGIHTAGSSTAYDLLRGAARDETATMSGALIQDVLLLAGSEDHSVPRTQLAEQLHSLTAARSVTIRLFTAAWTGATGVGHGDDPLIRLQLAILLLVELVVVAENPFLPKGFYRDFPAVDVPPLFFSQHYARDFGGQLSGSRWFWRSPLYGRVPRLSIRPHSAEPCTPSRISSSTSLISRWRRRPRR